MAEKRKIKRRFLLYYMRVYDNSTRKQLGNLVDITPQGIMIVSEKPIPENQTFHLRLELSNEITDKPYMEFAGISKWCRPDVSPSLYSVGFEITEMNKVDAEIIDQINDEYGFRDNVLKK